MATVDTHGSQQNVLRDISGNAIGDQLISASYWLQVVMPSQGPAAPGTASSYSLLAGGIYNSGEETLTNGQQSALQLNSSGYLLVALASTSLGYDTNYGTVGSSTLRTASQIGNATGAADFGAGATDAQTLRVVANQGAANTVANAWPIEVTNGTSTAFVTPASTAAVAANPALVVALSPNSPLPAGTNLLGSINQGTSPWITKDQSDGPVTPGTVASFSQLAGGQYNSTPPTLTTGQQAALQVDSAGRLLVDANVVFPYDENYGTVGATTLRVACQIGNATGAANFNYGTVGAQTLRTASQIGNATGAADFGAGATDAQTLRVASNLYDGSGNAISSTGGALNVSATQSGTWTVQQGSAPWSFTGNLTNNNAAPAANNIGALVALAEGTLSASRYTSGDQVLLVTDLAGNTNVDLQYYKGAAVSTTNPIATTISDGTNVITAAISAYGTAPTGTEVMGVNAYITNIPTVNQGTSPWIVKDLSDGSVNGGTAGTFSSLAGGVYNSTPLTLTTGQQSSLQLDVNGYLDVDLKTPIPAGTNLIGAVNLDLGSSPVSSTNPVPVSIVSTTPGTAVQDYHTSVALAAGASVTFTYTVAASHTFNFERVWASSSVRIKVVVQNNGSTIFVGFNSSANPNVDITITAPPLIAAAATATVTITNIDLVASDVYATLEGNQN
jgi:hypothetical protein